MNFPILEVLIISSIAVISMLLWMVLKLKEPEINHLFEKVSPNHEEIPDLDKVQDELDTEFKKESVEKKIRKAKKEKKIPVKKDEYDDDIPSLQKDFKELEEL